MNQNKPRCLSTNAVTLPCEMAPHCHLKTWEPSLPVPSVPTVLCHRGTGAGSKILNNQMKINKFLSKGLQLLAKMYKFAVWIERNPSFYIAGKEKRYADSCHLRTWEIHQNKNTRRSTATSASIWAWIVLFILCVLQVFSGPSNGKAWHSSPRFLYILMSPAGLPSDTLIIYYSLHEGLSTHPSNRLITSQRSGIQMSVSRQMSFCGNYSMYRQYLWMHVNQHIKATPLTAIDRNRRKPKILQQSRHKF